MAEESHKYKGQLMKIIRLILSTTSRETIRIEVMKYLSSDFGFFQEFLMDKIDSNSHAVSNIQSDSEQLHPKNDNIDKMSNSSLDTGEASASFEARKTIQAKRREQQDRDRLKAGKREVARVLKKKNPSKYEKMDFSHIHREPKRLKKKKLKSQTNIRQTKEISTVLSSDDDLNNGFSNLPEKDSVSEFIRKFLLMAFDSKFEQSESTDAKSGAEKSVKTSILSHVGDMIKDQSDLQLDTDIKKGDEQLSLCFVPGDADKTVASSLIKRLIESKSKAQQNEVLELLRSNETLRRSFLKEANCLGRIKVPVFHTASTSTLQDEENYQSCKESKEYSKCNDSPLQGTTSTMGSETRQKEYLIGKSIVNAKILKYRFENDEFNLEKIQNIARSSADGISDSVAAINDSKSTTSTDNFDSNFSVNTHDGNLHISIPDVNSTVVGVNTIPTLNESVPFGYEDFEDIQETERELYLLNNVYITHGSPVTE